ncbi:hypothetical protein EMPS_09131 [Entomortierella parvispora]|uniref:Uncharacterized protein n=1 Tax=Entomortierella parvispora TaxID=205924 RepID=A0A9P3HI68_9FUNG|nr:hypothetical protein EMPS_09131 [Entomortierella parvispora]
MREQTIESTYSPSRSSEDGGLIVMIIQLAIVIPMIIYDVFSAIMSEWRLKLSKQAVNRLAIRVSLAAYAVLTSMISELYFRLSKLAVNHLEDMVPLVAYTINTSIARYELCLRLSRLAINRLEAMLVWIRVVKTLVHRLAAGDSIAVAIHIAFAKKSISERRTSPLELPEVLFLIAPYIEMQGNESICCSLRVCKTWYRSFIHLIWGDLQLHGTQTPYRYIVAKRGLVRSLALLGDVPVRYALLDYPHLTRLEVKTNFGSVITDLVNRHGKSLRQIRLKGRPHTDDNDLFWCTLANLPRLQGLEMTDMAITDNIRISDLDVIFSAPCVELTLQNVSTHGNRRPAHLEKTWAPTPLRLQKVVFRAVCVKRVFAEELANRLKCCPNLQSLEWGVVASDARRYCPLVPVEDDPDNENGNSGTLSWPSLTKFKLTVPQLPDDQVGAILRSLQRSLAELKLQQVLFSHQAADALISRHARTLKDIDLQGCTALTEEMEVAIITACRHLIAFGRNTQ